MKEITPKAMRCDIRASCPGLHEIDDSECVAVIGKLPSPELIQTLAHKVGPDEALVVVPKALLKDIEWSEQ